MISRLLNIFNDNTRRRSRRHSYRDVAGAKNIAGLVEFMEQRMLLSGNGLTGVAAYFNGGGVQHSVTILSVKAMDSGGALLENDIDGVLPANTATIVISGQINNTGNPLGDPTNHQIVTISTLGLSTEVSQAFVVNSATTQPAPFTLPPISVSSNLAANGVNVRTFGLKIGRTLTQSVDIKDPGDNGIDANDTNLTATLRINRVPSTQSQFYAVFEGSAMVPLVLGVSDPDPTDNFTVRINSVPAGGQLFKTDGITPISSGSDLDPNTDGIMYIPGAMQVGTDFFTFSATDGVGGSSEIRTATITLVPKPSGTPLLAAQDDTGQDRNGDNVTDDEPAPLIIDDRQIDRVTSVTSGLTFSIDAPGVDSVEFRATNVGTNVVTTGAGTRSGNTFSADLNLPPGTYDVIASSTVGSNPPVDSDALRLNIDNTAPAAPVAVPQGAINKGGGIFLTTDATPQFDLTDIEKNALIIVERADHGSATFHEISRLFPADTNSMIPPFTDNSLTATGSYSYRFKQIDIAGNDPPSTVTVVIDNVAPTITNLSVDAIDPDMNQAINLLDSDQPKFAFTVTDQKYAIVNNPLEVQLLINGQPVLIIDLVNDPANTNPLAKLTLNNPAGMDGVFAQLVRLTPAVALVPGHYTFEIFVTDPDLAMVDPNAARATSENIAISGTVTSDDTQGAPGTPVFGRIYDMRNIGPTADSIGDPVLLLDVNGDPIPDLDTNGIQKTDGNGVLLFKQVVFRGAQFWQTSFDKTTQTNWINLERGRLDGVVFKPGTVHFDPATGRFELFDFATIFGDDAVLLNNTNPATDFRNPHGNAFDFDGHVNPRLFVVHRNAVGGSGRGQIGGDGRISYIEVRANAAGQHRVVSYDIPALSGLSLTDMHAAFVDAKGTVWVTSSEKSSILEIDFDFEESPAGSGNAVESATIDSQTARVKVHKMPIGLLTGDTGTAHSKFHGHALKVVVDDQTGEQYVWIASDGGKGQIALLRPEASPDGKDVWMSWNVADTVPMGSDAADSRVPFVDIDDNETSGDPTDDRIIFMAPVDGPEGATSVSTVGIVQVFEPWIIPNDPMSFTAGRVRTYQVRGLNGGFAATNQPFVDREGGIYWIDRLTGVGRIDIGPAVELNPADSNPPTGTEITPDFFSTIVDQTFFLKAGDGTVSKLISPTVGFAKLEMSEPFYNRGIDLGVNQYAVHGDNAQIGLGAGLGPFRGAINAGNVLYGTNSNVDELSASVFAETTRRQMAVVRTSDTLTQGAIVEGRMAFQVVRTKVDPTSREQVGAVIMTFRNDGDILDKQVNLTSLVARDASRPNAIVRPQDIAMDGDVSAVRDALGNVYVVGKGGSKDLIAYKFDSALKTWNYMEFGDSMQILPAEPTAVLLTDPATTMQRLVILATNSHGRLLKFDGAGPATDLTAVNVENSAMAAYGNLSVVRNSTGGGFSVYAVNQQGGVVQYILNPDLTRDSGPTLLTITSTKNGAGADLFTAEEIRVFQSVSVVEVNGVRHLFGNDGASRLVHMTRDDVTGSWTAENVTKLTSPNATGYFSFQQEYAARIYSEIAVVQDLGSMFVYGTNGGDLVEFRWDGANWKAANLTNDMTRGTQPTTRVTANNVFGAPDAYVAAPDGARHVMQINGEGEVVEYVLNRDGSFATQNINLARGNDVSDLREFSKAPIIRLPGGPALYAQNGMASTLDTNTVLVDDAASLDKQSIVIRVVDFSPGDVISFKEATGDMVLVDRVAVGTFTSSVDQSKVTVMLNETATRERVEMLLRQVQFSQRPVDPTKPLKLRSRLVDVTINDDQGKPLANAVKALAVLSVGALDSPIDGKILA